jgi:class 3 adenylate cyclase/tetratricopeptide (TPR) repeat protein
MELPREDHPSREHRRMVSVVFSDLTGSTSMGEKLDTESLRRVMLRYYAEMRFALERHGGTVEKFIGDAVMAVFGIPTLHEDDALRAVRAAIEMKEALARLNDELDERWGVRLRTRTGVNTGEVVAGDPDLGEGFIVGDAVNVAARLEQAAPTDEILIGEDTHLLVEDAVVVEAVEPLTLKGKAEPVPAFRLLDVSRQGPTRQLGSPLVGRERELAHLSRVFEDAIRSSSAQLLTVAGDAGVGKSRLLLEFLSALRGRSTVLRGRCLSYGEGITYWPLSEIVKEAAKVRDDESPEEARAKIAALMDEDDAESAAGPIAAALGLAEAQFQTDEIFLAFRRLFEQLAQERPLVLVFDDVHWGEETFLDLLEYLIETIGGSPVTILCLARVELRQSRPSLMSVEGRRDLILLEPLAAEQSEQLVENLLGQGLPSQLSQRITAAAQGNPLFVQETLRMLVDEGLLQRDDGRWRITRDLEDVGVPPTIEALLAARLDRLRPHERSVLERASVVGSEFWLGAVSELSPKVERGEVAAQLDALVERELIEPGGQSFAGENAYRFSHMLVRDVAYGGLLKEVRSSLHERFADWLEDQVRARIGEYEEILGYHLDRAYWFCEELGPVDERGFRLAGRAFRYLSVAGTDAHARGDMPASVKLLQRAIALPPEQDRAKLELELKLGQALFHVGDFDSAGGVCRDTAEAAASLGDRGLELHALLESADIETWTSPEGSLDKLAETSKLAIEVFEKLDDPLGLARGWRALSLVHSDAACWGAATDALERALTYAERSGDREVYSQVLGSLAAALAFGPAHVDEAIERLQQILAHSADPGARTTRVSLSTHALVEVWGLASLLAMRGEFEAARRLCSDAKEQIAELGQRQRLASLAMVAGRIAALADATETAETELRFSYGALEEMGDKIILSTVAAELAELALAQGRPEEAETLARESERLAGPDDVESQIRWRAALAKVLAWRGAPDAHALAREAVRRVAAIQFPNLEAHARLALAEVLHAGGRHDEAAPFGEDAVAAYERKGNVVAAAQARARLAEMRSGAPRPALR